MFPCYGGSCALKLEAAVEVVVVVVDDQRLAMCCRACSCPLPARRRLFSTTSTFRIFRIRGRSRVPFHHGKLPHGVWDVILGLECPIFIVVALETRTLFSVLQFSLFMMS